MTWMIDEILAIIGLALLIILIAGILAPFESLGWWAGWDGKPVPMKKLLENENGEPGIDIVLDEERLPVPKKDLFVIYLSGIGVASADGLAKDEVDFINLLEKELPQAAIITDVFPYSVTNNPLTGHRFGRPLWQKIRKAQEKNQDSLLAMITINIRNVLQVMVSADPRYGPFYSIGVAEEAARSLARHGYPLSTNESIPGKPVYLIGFSGGGQVSVGMAPYLSTMINAPIHIISIGGVISDDPGILYVSSLTHLFGEKDPVQGLGELLWPARRPNMPLSDWNRVKAKGRIRLVNMGPMAHNSHGGYYDIRVVLPDQQTYCAATTTEVKKAILANSSSN
jgi:hypothetical protein